MPHILEIDDATSFAACFVLILFFSFFSCINHQHSVQKFNTSKAAYIEWAVFFCRMISITKSYEKTRTKGEKNRHSWLEPKWEFKRY